MHIFLKTYLQNCTSVYMFMITSFKFSCMPFICTSFRWCLHGRGSARLTGLTLLTRLNMNCVYMEEGQPRVRSANRLHVHLLHFFQLTANPGVYLILSTFFCDFNAPTLMKSIKWWWILSTYVPISHIYIFSFDFLKIVI